MTTMDNLKFIQIQTLEFNKLSKLINLKNPD